MKTKLIITNLKDFFKHGFDRPFKMLYQIEEQVHRITESDNIHFGEKTKVLLADYKYENYEIFFYLQSYEFKNDCHIFYYEFNSVVS